MVKDLLTRVNEIYYSHNLSLLFRTNNLSLIRKIHEEELALIGVTVEDKEYAPLEYIAIITEIRKKCLAYAKEHNIEYKPSELTLEEVIEEIVENLSLYCHVDTVRGMVYMETHSMDEGGYCMEIPLANLKGKTINEIKAIIEYEYNREYVVVTEKWEGPYIDNAFPSTYRTEKDLIEEFFDGYGTYGIGYNGWVFCKSDNYTTEGKNEDGYPVNFGNITWATNHLTNNALLRYLEKHPEIPREDYREKKEEKLPF